MTKQAQKIRPMVMHYTNAGDNATRTQCGVEINSTSPRRLKPLTTDRLSEVDCKRCLASWGSAERGCNSY